MEPVSRAAVRQERHAKAHRRAALVGHAEVQLLAHLDEAHAAAGDLHPSLGRLERLCAALAVDDRLDGD